MILHLVKPDALGQLAKLAINAGPRVPLPTQFFELFAVFPLTSAYQRSQHLEARGRGQMHDLIDDLLHSLRRDDTATPIAMRCPDTSKEETKVIVDLRDGPYGGTRIFAGSFLLDGDGWR